jgi:hypothetical protein
MARARRLQTGFRVHSLEERLPPVRFVELLCKRKRKLAHAEVLDKKSICGNAFQNLSRILESIGLYHCQCPEA